MYDAIDAHEKQGIDMIPIEWLRDYADDAVMQYEQLAVTGVKVNNKETNIN